MTKGYALYDDDGDVISESGEKITSTVYKSYTATTQGVGTGTFYIGGFYAASGTDANLTQASATVNFGEANRAMAAHVFIVAGGAGSASGGSGTVEIEVSGTSITDAGVRTTSDTEVIVADVTTMSLNGYYETSKKWLGQVTFTLKNSSGSTHTTFSADFNYGVAKYEDFGNKDFKVTDFECVGLAGSNETDFDVILYHHNDQNWTYAATGFTPTSTKICQMTSDYSTDDDLDNGENFAYKRAGLSTNVTGSALEGVIVCFSTTSANAVEYMEAHIGVIFN